MQTPPDFHITPRRGPTVDPAWHSWYFHPFHPAVRMGPVDFRAKLKELDEGLEVTWHPLRERWCVWVRDPRINHPICRGWRLVMIWHGPDDEYVPLDERLLASLYLRSSKRWGNMLEYWLRVEAEIERDDAARKVKKDFETFDQISGWFDHQRIQVGYGQSSGSKFATYHAGG